ncbi:hypothetical protein A1OO_11120 [Enterovibrio norvegicus FF-33]|uniref:hypothetical protein n=1 Tax=Enterovibrio norvegicus TaxID=188144 RepID=UPI0002EAF885|nr:hypothetical protein [Enterovibrio norvegicus]OEE66330.1 hypothetical protein A1OO_11120 [Enterovibrio norvegicus FF-33]
MDWENSQLALTLLTQSSSSLLQTLGKDDEFGSPQQPPLNPIKHRQHPIVGWLVVGDNSKACQRPIFIFLCQLQIQVACNVELF